MLIRSENKNISIISKENDGDISPCLFLSQPIGYIMNFDSFITIFWMFGSGNNHFRISISDLKQRSAFSLKCFLPGNVVADLNINLLAASLSNKVDLLVLLSCSFSLPVLGNQLLLLSDAVDWFLTPTARRFSKGSNHSLFVTLLIS